MSTVYRALQRARTEARIKFIGDLSVARERVVEELEARSAPVSPTAGMQTVLQVARVVSGSQASMDAVLHRFAESVRPSLHTYVALATRFEGEPVITPDAYAVLEHINTHTDEPIVSNWWTRVLTSAQYTYRAWRRMRREHRDSGPQDGVPR